ncbi:MAG: hypothetical protein LBS44_03470 [Deltaproteobacteria bacterium]|jgi:hypothetical protein|nr:hypothetical protein [Deltaproteobacteria bacterium]
MTLPPKTPVAPKPSKSPWGPLGLFFLFLALLGLALVPNVPGFWVFPLALSLIILPLKGPKAILSDLKHFFGPQNKGRLKSILSIALVLILLLIFGSFTGLPVLNLAAPPEAVLPEETLSLLKRLSGPVSFKAHLAYEAAEGPVRHLMDLYQRASSLITASVSPADGQSVDVGGEIRVARSDTILIEADGFAETVSPISRYAIDRSLRRLLAPNRLVFNLMGDGEKSALDQSPRGLSRWAESLAESRIFFQDLAWLGPGLPAEALAADALVLAGPFTPLGPEKSQALIDFVANGGKLLILQEPTVVGFETSSLAEVGLDLPRGLLVDQEAAWAGTDDLFIVARDFPAHPITLGLEQPVIWPLAGALTLPTTDKQRSADENQEVPLLRLVQEPEESGPNQTESQENNEVTKAGLNEEATEKTTEEATESASVIVEADKVDKEIIFQTWAVALSSEAAWLETDLDSISRGLHRYQADEDRNGPLVLAAATSVNGRGRLAVTADADLAANAFINYGGNLDFLTNTLYWLMGAEDDLVPSGRRGLALDINHQKAQLLFWIPSVFWPLLALIAWYIYYRRRRYK